MADQVLVTMSALEGAQKTLNGATTNAQQCAQDAKNTMAQLQGAWKGAAADSYMRLLEEVAPKMEQAAQVYQDIAKKLQVFANNIDTVDQGF